MDNSEYSTKYKPYKVVLVGPQSAGKSSIFMRIIYSKFQQNYNTTIGVDFKSVDIDVGERKVEIQLWDTAGQEKFRSLTKTYFKGASGAICVFDIQDKKSASKCQYYIQEALNENIKKQCILLVGSKIDGGEEFCDDGKKLAQQYNINFMECSSKTGQGVKEVIQKEAELLVENVEQTQMRESQLRPNIQISENEGRRCGC